MNKTTAAIVGIALSAIILLPSCGLLAGKLPSFTSPESGIKEITLPEGFTIEVFAVAACDPSGNGEGDEFVVPNWWMGMATRQTSRGRLTFTGMLSLDPATVGKDGYREIFQAGEAPQSSCLTATRGTNEDQEFFVSNIDIQVVDRDDVAKFFDDIFKSYSCHDTFLRFVGI